MAVALTLGVLLLVLGFEIVRRPAGSHPFTIFLAGCFGVFLALTGIGVVATGL